MFLDLAYTVRMLLRRLGYGSPDVVGLLFAPMISTRASRQGTSNPGVPSHASPGTAAQLPAAARQRLRRPGRTAPFRPAPCRVPARYLEKEPPLTDPGPPFARTVLLPIPEEAQTRAAAEVVGMAARFLLDDSCFGLGRLSAAARAGLPAPPPAQRPILRDVRHLSADSAAASGRARLATLSLQKLVRRWISKDTRCWKTLCEPGSRSSGAATNWGRSTSSVACNGLRESAGQAPEAAFNAALQPLLAKLGEGATAGPKASGRSKPDKNKPIAVLNPEDVAEVLARYQDLLGKPEGVEDTAPAAAPDAAPRRHPCRRRCARPPRPSPANGARNWPNCRCG